MNDLKFKHLPINQSFIKGCGLFVKVSKTQAISFMTPDKYKFKANDPVSLTKTLNYSSFNQGSMKSSYNKAKVSYRVEVLIEEYNKAGK